MPVDIVQGDQGTVPAPGTIFDPKIHKSHFATCPAANKFRRER